MRSGKDGDKRNPHLAPFSFVAEYTLKAINSHTPLDFSLPFNSTTAHNETFFALSVMDQRLSLQEPPLLHFSTIRHRGELSYNKAVLQQASGHNLIMFLIFLVSFMISPAHRFIP